MSSFLLKTLFPLPTPKSATFFFPMSGPSEVHNYFHILKKYIKILTSIWWPCFAGTGSTHLVCPLGHPVQPSWSKAPAASLLMMVHVFLCGRRVLKAESPEDPGVEKRDS